MTPTPPTDTPAPNSARAALVAQAQADGDYGMTPTPAAVAAAREYLTDYCPDGADASGSEVAHLAAIIERQTRLGELRLSLELVGRACGKLYMADADGGTVLVEDFVAAALSAAPAAGEEGK